MHVTATLAIPAGIPITLRASLALAVRQRGTQYVHEAAGLKTE